ncbi:hypothetical protein RZP29_12665 [Klebsiella quasipneumoniae subsp. similipneumoniae]|uniref:Uncharacterized protein n=1 Tax=Klebsiella quasipneumoniae subsp. similipneumoniae TaxID=1463164 RepID=A0AAE4SH66_9ENTR|nr:MULTISPECIES: hypothetical protein [Klebsiella]MBD7804733.1 hypothetical protein [Klebsiella pneumoniae]MDU3361789.1 hypothetical protein [Klebsiella sp.]MDV0611512.1 hypothetical protein [Klebsiella quasipneumoniae subsp. similipneumoniae]MDV0641085.1 hypothetical protein [Klebsiella quasipneumoniae subsp. similipneumoniae]MDV0650734.1 hypothetical protein [Klebsiella quasipneumoniae subsp. similipneumoniae]
MMHLLVVSATVIFGLLAFIAVMSFMTWENYFRLLGRNCIIRMMIVLLILSWANYFIFGGAA